MELQLRRRDCHLLCARWLLSNTVGPFRVWLLDNRPLARAAFHHASPCLPLSFKKDLPFSCIFFTAQHLVIESDQFLPDSPTVIPLFTPATSPENEAWVGETRSVTDLNQSPTIPRDLSFIREFLHVRRTTPKYRIWVQANASSVCTWTCRWCMRC